MIGILCDSGADTPGEVLRKYPIEVVPLRVVMNEKEYRDIYEVNNDQLIEYMENNIPKTSLPTFEDIKKGFLNLIEKGYKEIIAISISSGLSGTNNLFRLVSEELKKENSDLKIAVVDSLSISIATGLMVYKAAKLVEMGNDFDSILKTLEEYKEKIKVYYSIPTLKFLKAGGRINRVAATVGEVLNLKPVITVGEDGKYHAVAKSRGMKKAVEKMLQSIKEFASGKDIEAIGIYRSGDRPETIDLVEKVKASINELNVPKIFQDKISAAMLVHTGVGLIGIAVMVS